MGRLTTHVLDTSSGKPAAGLKIELWSLAATPELIKTVSTNRDGRVDGAILEGDDFKTGTYELRFHAGDYLRASGVKLAEPAFLDVIPIRFGIERDVAEKNLVFIPLSDRKLPPSRVTLVHRPGLDRKTAAGAFLELAKQRLPRIFDVRK